MTLGLMESVMGCHDMGARPVTTLLLVLAAMQGLCVGAGPLIPDEQRLYERIMGNYVRAVKPVVRSDLPLQVLFSIRLKQIVDLDERQQVLTTNVFIDQTWIDSALAWNASEFSDVTSLRIPADQIWKPDTFIYNNADNGSTGFVSGKFIQIRHNGAVTWPVPVRLRSSCVVKIAYFPFDYQRCSVKFGSWIYSHDFMDYTIRPDAVSVDLTTYVNNSEWELLSMTMEKDTKRRAMSDNIHPFLTMTIYLRRNTFFYLFNIIVPCIMLSMLTLMTFWLPPTSGEKVTLGLSVFLAFSMFMLLIADEVPASSDAVPIIGIYLCVVMTMTSLSVILAVLVTNLYYRGTKLRSAPRWFARLFIRVLAVPMCVSRDIELLATTIILPDHCRFFLIHNKFDFPTCNINAYNKFNRSKKHRSDSIDRKQQRNKSLRMGGDEGQRYVFDHQDPQRMWNSRSYTSGKRSHATTNRWGGRTADSSQQNTNFGEMKYEYPTADTFGNSDGDCIESCNSETDLDEHESTTKRKKNNHENHSHCSLQHLCDSNSTFSSRKSLSPFIDKFFLNAKNRKPRRCSEYDHNSNKPNALTLSEEALTTTNDNASFTGEDGEIHVVTVDVTPAGATIDKSFPFKALTSPSSFLINSDPYTSPNQRRRQLIKTMKHYSETKDGSVQTPSTFHQNVVSCDDVSRADKLCSTSDSPHSNRKLFKRHRNSKRKNNHAGRGAVSDCSSSMNDLRLQDNALRNRKLSSENVSKTSNSRKHKNASSLSSSCTIFNTNIPFEARAEPHSISQSSNHLQNHDSPHSNNKTHHRHNHHHNHRLHSLQFPVPLASQQNNRHPLPARLCTFPVRDIKPEATEDTFCRCSESQEDVWVPYDANDNSSTVWCFRDDSNNAVDYSPLVDKDYEDDWSTVPLLQHNTTHYLNSHNPNDLHTSTSSSSTSTRRAKKQNSLSQQSVEQFLDERSRLILSKSRLVMAEWQTIAAVIDRLLFLVALFATIFAYIFLLVIVPSEHNLDSFNMSKILPTSTGRYDWMSNN